MSKLYFEKIIFYFLFIAFFCVFLVEHILGVQGFASMPYINILIYIFSVILIFLFFRVNLLKSSINTFFLFYVFIVGISFFNGIFYDNSLLYLIAWTGYFVFSAFGYILGYSASYYDIKKFDIKQKYIGSIFLFGVIFLLYSLSGNGFSYVLVITILISSILYGKSFSYNLFLFFLLFFVHFNIFKFGFDLSRATVITIIIGFLVGFLYLKKFFSLYICLIFILCSYLVILNISNDSVDSISSRSMKEGVMLLRGDSIDNHIATAQRFYEIEAVKQDYEKTNILQNIFGLGFGNTIDMTQSDDSSVGGAALQGEKSVNNVHFLPYAIFHKMGYLGVLFLIFLVLYISYMYIIDVINNRRDKVLLFCYIYMFCVLAYSSPASNYLIANPLFSIILGYCIGYRKFYSGNNFRLR